MWYMYSYAFIRNNNKRALVNNAWPTNNKHFKYNARWHSSNYVWNPKRETERAQKNRMLHEKQTNNNPNNGFVLHSDSVSCR